jgi:hypothetical protein
MGRNEMVIRLVLIAALLFFVYWNFFNGGQVAR